MLDYQQHICPRCFGAIPNNATPGMYIGAISRFDNKTEICSECGTEEALVGIIPTNDWPIILYDHPACKQAQIRFQERLELQNIHLGEL